MVKGAAWIFGPVNSERYFERLFGGWAWCLGSMFCSLTEFFLFGG